MPYEKDNSVHISVTIEKRKYDDKIDSDEFGDWIDEDFINEQVLKGDDLNNRIFTVTII